MTGQETNGGQRQQWDTIYHQKDFFGEKPSILAESVLPVLEGNSVKEMVELGCGQGRDTWYFARNGIKVTAMDYSQTGVCQMRECAEERGLTDRVTMMVQDLRQGILLPDSSMDAVYSHMLLCMELNEEEVQYILDECKRVLRPGGLNIFSVRNEHDPHYGKFEAVGKDMWKNPLGLVVHFFPLEKVKRYSQGWEIVSIKDFEDGAPPFNKVLYEVVLRKPK